MGGTSSEYTAWNSATQIVCKFSDGIDRSKALTLTHVSSSSTISLVFTYDVQTIHETTHNSKVTQSIIPFVATGLSYSLHDFSHRLRVGFTSCEETVWSSDTVMSCLKLSSGVGHLVRASLTATERRCTTTTIFSYDQAAVVSLHQNKSNLLIGLEGFNFGISTRCLRIRLASTSCKQSNWISDSQIFCVVSSGAARSRAVAVTISVLVSTRTDIFSYESSTASSVAPYNHITVLKTIINISVFNEARNDLTSQARIGKTHSEFTRWFSETSLLSLFTGYFQACEQITITTAIQTGTCSGMISFDRVELSNSTPSNIQSKNSGTTLLVYGFDKNSTWKLSISGRIVGTSLLSTVWISTVQILCLTSHWGTNSLKPNSSLIVTTLNRVSSISSTFTFDLHTISTTSQSNVKSSGHDAFYLGGYALVRSALYSPSARFGYSNTISTIWCSDSSLRSLAVTGFSGTQHALMLTLNSMINSISQASSYDSPTLSTPNPGNGLRPSGYISLHGSDFSTVSFSPRVSSKTSSEFSRWISDSSIVVKPATCVQSSQKVSVSNGLIVSTISEILTFDPPSLQIKLHNRSIPPDSLLNSAKLSTTMFIFVIGQKQIETRIHTSSVRISSTQSSSSLWNSDSSIVVKLPSGQEKSRSVIFSISSMSQTLSNTISYDTSPITGVMGTNMFLGSPMYLYFAMKSELFNSVSARISGSKLLSTRWQSDSSVACKFSFGSSSSSAAQITFAVLVGSSSEIVSYDQIILSSAQDHNVPSTGSNKIMLIPGIIPSQSLSVAVRSGQTALERSAWVSSSSITARIASGVFFWKEVNQKVVVSILRIIASASDLISYDAHVISTSKRANLQPVGATKVTLMGLAFGSSGYTLAFSTQKTISDATLWSSDTSLQSKFSGGEARSQAVKLTQNHLVETMTVLFSFDKPAFLRQYMINLDMNRAPIDSLPIAFRTSYVGLNGFTSNARSALTACERSLWQSDTLIVCKQGPLEYFTSVFSLTVSLQLGSGSSSVSFDVPKLSGMESYNRRVFLPSKDATIFGTNYGFSTKSLNARAFTACEQTIWTSFSTLSCREAGKIQKGQSLMMILTIHQKVSSISKIWSYDSVYLSSVDKQNYPGTGSVMLHLEGVSVGFCHSSLAMRTSDTSAEVSVWTSDSSILAKSSSGASRSCKLEVTVNLIAGTGTETISFFKPQIHSNFTKVNFPFTGSSRISVHGSNFAHTSMTATIRSHVSNSLTTTWQAQTTIICKVRFIVISRYDVNDFFGRFPQAWRIPCKLESHCF